MLCVIAWCDCVGVLPSCCRCCSVALCRRFSLLCQPLWLSSIPGCSGMLLCINSNSAKTWRLRSRTENETQEMMWSRIRTAGRLNCCGPYRCTRHRSKKPKLHPNRRKCFMPTGMIEPVCGEAGENEEKQTLPEPATPSEFPNKNKKAGTALTGDSE